MTYLKFIIAAALSCLAFVPGARAQYRWHVVLPDHPDQTDTSYRGIASISCSGENCTATEVIWSRSVSDSNVILHSGDGGLTWDAVDGGIPQRRFDTIDSQVSNNAVYFNSSQQIDSVNAIASDAGGVLLSTHDGWKTWHVDNSLSSLNTEMFTVSIDGIDFANAAEGMAWDPFGIIFSTVDSGNHWKREDFKNGAPPSAYHSYGDSMFRLFTYPATIMTTHDNWDTRDTTLISWAGPLQDTSFHFLQFFFSNGDSIAIEGYRWDREDIHSSLAMILSTDLGKHWSELPIPPNNGVTSFANTDLDWNHMVLAGDDSLGRVLISSDRGQNWMEDTVPLSSGVPYYRIFPFAVTGSGRVLASIEKDGNYMGSSSLAYLEQIPSDVKATASVQNDFAVFPNPAINEIQIPSNAEKISILDPLGRAYNIKRAGNTLDISSLPPGVYFVSDGVKRAKFVKE